MIKINLYVSGERKNLKLNVIIILVFYIYETKTRLMLWRWNTCVKSYQYAVYYSACDIEQDFF